MKPYSNVEYDYQKAEEEQYYYEEVEEVSDPVGSDVEVAMTGSGHRIVVNSDDTSKIREHNYLFEKSSQIPKGLDCKGAEDKEYVARFLRRGNRAEVGKGWIWFGVLY